MGLENATYDLGKWLVLIFLPAVAALVGGLGELYVWADAAVWVATINLLTVFIGSILQLSSQVYYDDSNSFGGGMGGPSCS